MPDREITHEEQSSQRQLQKILRSCRRASRGIVHVLAMHPEPEERQRKEQPVKSRRAWAYLPHAHAHQERCETNSRHAQEQRQNRQPPLCCWWHASFPVPSLAEAR